MPETMLELPPEVTEESTTPERLKIDSEDDWEQFVSTELGGVVSPVTFSEVEPAGLLWRGMNPDEVLSLLRGHSRGIEIHSERANASPRWEDALAHHGAGRNPYPFNIVLGFRPHPENLQVDQGHLKGMKDIDIPSSVKQMEARYKRVNGTLTSDSVQYLIVRFRGNEPGKPKSPRAYQVNGNSLAARVEAQLEHAA